MALVNSLFRDAGSTKALCYIKEVDGVAVVLMPNGEPLPGQRGMVISLPLDGVVTVTVELVFEGVEAARALT